MITLRLEDLQTFIIVSDCRSMTKAAMQLHLSQQTISSTIKSLETELEKKLFTRSKNGTVLTPQGKEVYDSAKSILKQIDALYSHSELNSSIALNVHFTYQPGFSSYVNMLSKELKNMYPKSNFHAETLDAYHINLRIKNNTIKNEIYMTTINEAKLHEYQNKFDNYNIYLVEKSRIQLMVGDTSSWAHKKQISLYSLNKYPLAFYSPHNVFTETFFGDLLASYGVFIDTAIFSNDITLITQYIEKNLAATVSTSFADNISSSIENRRKLIPITPKINILFLILFPRNTSDSARLEEIFVKTFEKSIQRL